ncbi:unnamed protein product [Heligmosomoides polygyrus]|uniref:C2H2-type domain-containing protein n=1 Tax=Heligmosomoides polygyrus TaxID=6339 RepID=A0A3P8B7B4_HELPZ|nr:unnamed protein product [Heligmosomoides polygyrus]
MDDDHEQLLVRDGIVVGLQQPNGRFFLCVLGVADEVESYPCPLCPERVFLTSFGLERHSTEKHPAHLQEVIDHIETISAEWRRREEELARRRDRMYSSRLRQENIARHAIEQVANGTLVKEQRFKSCNLCGMLIDAESPTAMEHHLLEHKKNDDLKHKLLARFGAEEVGRLMCRDCNLVFGDENSLLVHNDQMHIRRKKYICKWCGHVAHTMTELNLHKADVHAMPPFTAKSDRDRRFGLYFERHRHCLLLHIWWLSTTCEQCGLRLVRPSLLVRHMLRVHSKNAFSCEVSGGFFEGVGEECFEV